MYTLMDLLSVRGIKPKENWDPYLNCKLLTGRVEGFYLIELFPDNHLWFPLMLDKEREEIDINVNIPATYYDPDGAHYVNPNPDKVRVFFDGKERDDYDYAALSSLSSLQMGVEAVIEQELKRQIPINNPNEGVWVDLSVKSVKIVSQQKE